MRQTSIANEIPQLYAGKIVERLKIRKQIK
jgi:hypothetical protein